MNDGKLAPLERIEKVLNLKTTIYSLGYGSVFDIIKVSRKRFVSLHRRDLGADCAQAYDLAAGMANQISQLYKKDRRTTSTQRKLRSWYGATGLNKSGPTYQTLFQDDWSSYCLNGAPEANDSPVSYLSYIYSRALGFESDMNGGGTSEIITLQERRPDLALLVIDEKAIDEVVPALTMVNEVLESAVQPYVDSVANGKSVNEVLSVTHYPNLLPHHFAHEQAVLSLRSCGLSLLEVIQSCDVNWPYFSQRALCSGTAETALELGCELAPGQLSIVISAMIDEGADNSAFYLSNFGLKAKNFSESDLQNLPIFSSKTGLPVSQIEALVCCAGGASTVVASPNVPDCADGVSSAYGARYINSPPAPVSLTYTGNALDVTDDPDAIRISSLDMTLVNLGDERMDCINRMIRLQCWLEMRYDDIDLLVTSVMEAEGATNADFEMNANTLRALGAFHYFNEKFNVTPEQFAALIHQITPYAIAPNVPFFDRIFNSPTLFEEAFQLTGANFSYGAGDEADARTVKQLCAGLGVNEAQFQLLAAQVAKQQGDSEKQTLPCSLDVISALYRLATIPRLLGLTLADGLLLMRLLSTTGDVIAQLSAVPNLSPANESAPPSGGDVIDTLMALAAGSDWLHQNGIAPAIANLWQASDHDVALATTAELNFINEINQQLPSSLLTEAVFETSGVPDYRVDGVLSGVRDVSNPVMVDWMTLLDNVVDQNGLVMPVEPAPGMTVQDAIRQAVSEDIAGVQFAGSMSNEEIANILTDVIYQANISQVGIANSALANALKTGQTLPPFLLQWKASSCYDFLKQTWVLAGIKAPGEIPSDYQQLLLGLAQRASVTRQFGLSAAMLKVFLANPDWFGTTSTEITLPLLYEFSRYADLLKLTKENEDAVLAYLDWANQTADKNDAARAAALLSVLLDWEDSEVQLAAQHANPSLGIAQTLAQIDTVMRLQSLSQATHASVSAVLATGALTLSSGYADWQSVGESLVAVQSH